MDDHNIFEEVKKLRGDMVKQIDGKKYYRIIDDFSKSSIKENAKNVEFDCFRLFVPYKPEKGRMLNKCYGGTFDAKSNTLMDYPTIVSAKLGGSWDKYNRLISVHIAGCPLHCWHCYVDECLLKACGRCVLEQAKKCKEYGRGGEPNVTAHDIVTKFLEQRDKDARQTPIVHTNILRITGGEPFLVPDLILECLSILAEEGLDNQVYLWTETNLIPFLVDPSTRKSFIEDWGIKLNDFAKYKNFSVHPCIHGISEQSAKQITSHELEHAKLLRGLKKLIDAGIDIYPSFISSAEPPEEIPLVFKAIENLDKNLPLRFVLVKHDDYGPVGERLEALKLCKKGSIRTYNHEQAIEIWNASLKQKYDFPYAQIPRHVIPCPSKKNIDVINPKSITPNLIFFKSTYRDEYKDALIRTLFLPPGSEFSVEYDLKYLTPNIRENVIKNKSTNNATALFVFVDRNIKSGENGWARRFRPLRLAQLEKSKYLEEASWATFYFRLKEFVLPKNSWEASSDEIASRFIGDMLPGEDNAFYVVPVPELNSLLTEKTKSIGGWERIVDTLSEISDFQDTAFLRLDSLKDYRGNSVNFGKPILLKSGKTYTLSIISYVPNIKVLQDKYGKNLRLQFISESNGVNILSPTSSRLAKYKQHKIAFKCDGSFKNSISSIVVQIKGEEKTVGSAFHIPLQIQGRKGSICLGVSLIILGIALVTIAGLLPDTYEKYVFLLQVIGGTLTPAALLWITLKEGKK